MSADDMTCSQMADHLGAIADLVGETEDPGAAWEAVNALKERAERAEAERDRIRDAAKEFFNATVASQFTSPGYDAHRHAIVGATHPDMRDRINRASADLEAAIKETAQGDEG